MKWPCKAIRWLYTVQLEVTHEVHSQAASIACRHRLSSQTAKTRSVRPSTGCPQHTHEHLQCRIISRIGYSANDDGDARLTARINGDDDAGKSQDFKKLRPGYGRGWVTFAHFVALLEYLAQNKFCQMDQLNCAANKAAAKNVKISSENRSQCPQLNYN